MIELETVGKILSGFYKRNKKLVAHFQTFLQSLEIMNGDQYPVKGLSVITNELHADLNFLNRRYEIQYNCVKKGTVLLGMITFYLLENDGSYELKSFTFNGSGEADINSGDENITNNLNDAGFGPLVVLNLLLEDIPEIPEDTPKL